MTNRSSSTTRSSYSTREKFPRSAKCPSKSLSAESAPTSNVSPSRPPKRPAVSSKAGNDNPKKKCKDSHSSTSASDLPVTKTGSAQGVAAAKPEKSTTAITFGIEFEIDLAFHEDKLRDVLQSCRIEAKVVKDCSMKNSTKFSQLSRES